MSIRIKYAFLFMVIFVVIIAATYTIPNVNENHSQIKATSSALAKEIAEISSTFVYSFDKEQLHHSISIILTNNKTIRAVKITDSFTKNNFFSYYYDNTGVYYDEPIPEEIKRLTHSDANISFDGELIGKLELYYDQGLAKNTFENITNDFGYKLRILAVTFIFLLFLLYIVFHLLSSRSLTDDNPLSFGTNKFAIIVMVTMSVFVTFSIAGGWFILEQNKMNVESRLNESLNQTLNSIELNIDKVSKIRSGINNHITQKPQFQKILSGLIDASNKNNTKALNRYRYEAILFLNQYELFDRDESKAIIDLDGKILVSNDDSLKESDIDRSANSPFINAVSGKASFLLPTDLRSSDVKNHIFIVMPIFDHSGRVIAVSYNKIDSRDSVYADIRTYDFNQTGEVIITDSYGHILSNLRFDADVQKIDEFSRSVRQHLFKSEKGDSVASYGKIMSITDYRNEEVLAVIGWNKNLHAGFIAKIDKQEVMGDYYDFRNGVSIILAMMIFFSVPFTMFTLYVGKKSNEKVRASRYEVISRLGHAAEFKDNDTAQHIKRISLYSEILAKKLPVSKEWTKMLCDAAPMHDIGKIGVPDNILNKPGKLDPKEWEIMKRHPEFGAAIIGDHDSGLLCMAKEIALYHHEKWDGNGYPYGVSGDSIPLSARIIAVADVFDALTCERVYKKAWKVEDAIDLIKRESGKHFDPEIVDAFMLSIPEFEHIKRYYADRER